MLGGLRGNSFRSHIAVCTIFLCSCTPKPVTPVSMVQSGDEQLSCSELNQQVTANVAAVDQLLREDKAVENGNIAKNVGGVIPGLGLLLIASTDLSNAEQIKARAIIDRNERLNFLMTKRGCAQ